MLGVRDVNAPKLDGFHTVASKPTVIVVVELEKRELLGRLLLCIELAARGYRCYLGSARAVEELSSHFVNSIFILKSTDRKRVQKYKKSLGSTICILDEEAGAAIPRYALRQFVDRRFGGVTAEHYDHMFTIGPIYRPYIAELNNLEGVNVHETGWPRIDLWRPEFTDIYQEEIEVIEKLGPFVLYVSSFGFCDEASYQQLFSRARTAASKRRLQSARRALGLNLKLIEEITRRLACRVIFRPHTSESEDSWRSIFASNPKVLVDKSFDLAPWLHKSGPILTYQSTVALQAALMGKRVLQYGADDAVGRGDLALYRYSHCVDTLDDALAAISTWDDGQDKEKQRSEVISALSLEISSLTGPLAVERLSDILENQYSSPLPPVTPTRLRVHLSEGWHHYKKLENLLLRKLSPSKSRARVTRVDKIPNGISATKLAGKFSAIVHARNFDDRNLECSQVINDLVKIESLT